MFRRLTFVDISVTKGLVILFISAFDNKNPLITTSAKVTEVQRLLKLRMFHIRSFYGGWFGISLMSSACKAQRFRDFWFTFVPFRVGQSSL